MNKNLILLFFSCFFIVGQVLAQDNQTVGFDFNPCDSIIKEANQVITPCNNLAALSKKMNALIQLTNSRLGFYKSVKFYSDHVMAGGKSYTLANFQKAYPNMPNYYLNNPGLTNQYIANAIYLAEHASAARGKIAAIQTICDGAQPAAEAAKDSCSLAATNSSWTQSISLQSSDWQEAGYDIVQVLRDVCGFLCQDHDNLVNCAGDITVGVLVGLIEGTMDVMEAFNE